MQRGVRCLSAWAAANCSDNLEGPEQIQCDTVGVDSALCVCPVPALDETCNYLIPWSREAMLGCNVQPLKQSMEAGNCVAAVSEESCDDFCWARNAVCVKAMGSELCGSFAGQKQVHCNSTGLDERYCSCRGPKPTATRESDETQSQLASSHCDFLQPLWTGEEECKTGVVVGMLQDRGTQCVAYASLGGTRSCADFCQERWSTCTAALQSPAAPCEVAEASSFSCNDAVTTAHCVCAVPGPGRSLCQSSRSCHELCSFSMAGGYTSCYRRCTRRFGQIQQTMQKHCAHGNACQSSEPQNEELDLLQLHQSSHPSYSGSGWRDFRNCGVDELCAHLCGRLQLFCKRICNAHRKHLTGVLQSKCRQCLPRSKSRDGNPRSMLQASQFPSDPTQIKNRNGICLDASERKDVGGLVHMWPCDPSNVNQQWVYEADSRVVKNVNGYCLDASQRNTNGGLVHMWPCDPGNVNQQWDYQPQTNGILKNWFGICLDSPDRGSQGGRVWMWACNSNNPNQQWWVPQFYFLPMHNQEWRYVGRILVDREYTADAERPDGYRNRDSTEQAWKWTFQQSANYCRGRLNCRSFCWNPDQYSWFYPIPGLVFTNHYESSYGRGWHCYRKAPGTRAGTFRQRDSWRNLTPPLTTVSNLNTQKQSAMNNVWTFRRKGCRRRRRFSASDCETELHIIDTTLQAMAQQTWLEYEAIGPNKYPGILDGEDAIRLRSGQSFEDPRFRMMFVHEFCHAYGGIGGNHPSPDDRIIFRGSCEPVRAQQDDECTDVRAGSRQLHKFSCTTHWSAGSHGCGFLGLGCQQDCVDASFTTRDNNPQDWLAVNVAGCGVYYKDGIL